MVFMHGTAAVTFCVLFSFVPASAQDKPSPETAAKAVNDELARVNATGFVTQQVQNEAVRRVFPQHLFFGVYFRQYPVARMTPEGMNNANLYAVGPGAKPNLLKESKRLQDFFKTSLAVTTDEEGTKDAARAYVRLVEELHQDGFYKFALQEDSTRVKASKEGKVATARAVVMAGGNGEIGAVLTFDETGRLQAITESVKLKPGPRPICQASKLLDADPIVRLMAEQDLLIMGRAAKPYLDEQRSKAGSDLRSAIERIWERILQDDR